MSRSGHRPLIEVINGAKRFGNTTALDDVHVTVGGGEVVGLIGQNGAGKSTLLKTMCGIVQLDSGQLRVRGEPRPIDGLVSAADAGIGMVFQEQSLIPNLSVAENILLARNHPATSRGIVRRRRLEAYAREQLAKIDADYLDPSAEVSTLSFAERQSVELAKVVSLQDRFDGPPVALLDEPTSVLDGPQIEVLFRQIRRLAAQAGVVFVSHRLDEVLEISDRVYVMRDGRVVGQPDPKDCEVDDLYQLMVGAERSTDFYRSERKAHRASRTQTTPTLEVNGLSGNEFHEVTLAVHPGEVLGIAGVIGSGRTGLCRTIFGAEPAKAGAMTLNGDPFLPRSPATAARRGVGFVPAERRAEGMVSGASLSLNILAASRSGGALRSQSAETATVEHWINSLAIKAESADSNIDTLSGGNQQKAVLAKWLSTDLRLLVLDHPTRGLDVGAKQEVYEVIRSATAADVAIVLLSDTLDELLGLSDTILTMRDGQITARFEHCTNSPPSQADLVAGMV